ncbi:hypothetical protein D3P09_16665 [Paenibacillus pinisoli]|uniref:Uncharacterized protein n=1 Tax=Paenibacillus pinisoli TaxID=1276110 RepID=A0A3A6PZF5_9BACL|nr:hypothetical protein [Paenibacillus pinisoli]RJX39124.1 hypothetical protein D3P09_16665 [Paenibacillus pinisoli]
MIYGASLGAFVKKSMPDKGFQTNSQKLIELLPIDPAVTQMDVVVLGPKDMGGSKGKALREAILKKHDAIDVVYLYQKDAEADLVEGDVQKTQLIKLSFDYVVGALQSVIQNKSISGKHRIESGDTRGYSYDAEQEEQAAPESWRDEEEDDSQSLVYEEPPVVLETAAGLEARLEAIGKFSGFDALKKQMDKETIQYELKHENVQYAEAVNMLEELDAQIAKVFKDSTIPPDMRFEQLRQIGVNRAAYKGIENGLLADKLASVMDLVVQSAEEAVDARIRQMRDALDTITSTRLLYEDYGKLQELVDARMSVQMDLMELSKEIIEMYQAMDLSVNELIDQFQDKGPSGYPYVNDILQPLEPLFIPQNMAAITSRLLSDLNRNKVTFSIIEEKVKSVVNLVFKLCEEDATIIEYQQKLIKLLQAQRIEDVVIVDHVIKNSLRLFVGPSNTGRTATALTWSGVVSRRQNTLLLDLTGNTKLGQYGVEAVSLATFLEQRLEQPFLCVAGGSDIDLEQAEGMVAELKLRLNYYAHIHVLLDASQTELLSKLAPSALSVHFITDCTPRGTELLKPAVESFQEPNIAQKVILIDPPVDPMRMVQDLSIDPLLAKVIVLPRSQHIRACSLNRVKPFESKEVADIFEEAFR